MWTYEQEQYLKTLGEQAIGYTWMQEKTAQYYTTIDRYLGIIIIVLSGIVGTNNFVDTELGTREIIFGTISYLISILGMFLQFLKPQEVSQERINIGNKFQDIYLEIKQELAKDKDERVNADEYIKLLTERFIEVYEYSPQISDYVVKKFKTHFQRCDIAMPLNTNWIRPIQIAKGIDGSTLERQNDDDELKVIVIPKEEKKLKKTRQPRNEAFHSFLMSRLNHNI